MNLTIEKIEVVSENPGTTLVIFGAIHGNEPSGPQAIRNIIDRFTTGELTLLSGKVIFVPVANPGAFAENKRFLEEDLNRVFKDSDHPTSYESRLAQELGTVIQSGDAFLDIHTTAAPGPTCVFIDFPTPENSAFAEAMGMQYSLIGWPSLYANNPHGEDSYDTTRYVFENGKTGIIIECGQHEEPEGVRVAEESILRALIHFNMIDASIMPETKPTKTKNVRMTVLEYKQDDGDGMTREWDHLELISKGTTIATRADGQEIIAESDCIIILPKHAAKAGQEWFYLGTLHS